MRHKRLLAILLAMVISVSTVACRALDVDTAPLTGSEHTENTEATETETNTEGDTSTEGGTEETTEIASEEKENLIPVETELNFVNVAEYVPGIRIELKYAGTDNFTKKIIYDFSTAWLRRGTVDKLIKVQEELKTLGYSLKIWDAYRPVSAQEALWEAYPDANYVADPAKGFSAHSRGNTIDVTLVKLDGSAVAMPTGFDDFTALADRDYSDCEEAAAKNAKLLEDIMTKHGFKGYEKEWWHFTDTTQYQVEEFFNPSNTAYWKVNCKSTETIAFTKSASKNGVLANLPDDTIVEVLDWEFKYARVLYNGRVGYVYSPYIEPINSNTLNSMLGVVRPTSTYTYDQMMYDIAVLQQKFPDVMVVEVAGQSELGRDIPVIRLGNENASHHVLIQSTVHAREHMASWLTMATVDYCLHKDRYALNDVCFHIFPMMNPDGVTISQFGLQTPEQHEIYASDLANNYTRNSLGNYAKLWKANGLGVDINRCFPANWGGGKEKHLFPSSMQYDGKEPFDSAESRILRDYTMTRSWDATISYHATGSIIYYEYGNKPGVNAASKDLAYAVYRATGFLPQKNATESSAGYKDWAMDAFDIPSLTIEVGCDSAPLAYREINQLFARNHKVLNTLADWVKR